MSTKIYVGFNGGTCFIASNKFIITLYNVFIYVREESLEMYNCTSFCKVLV